MKPSYPEEQEVLRLRHLLAVVIRFWRHRGFATLTNRLSGSIVQSGNRSRHLQFCRTGTTMDNDRDSTLNADEGVEKKFVQNAELDKVAVSDVAQGASAACQQNIYSLSLPH